jgi:Flp pilus assembly protein TadD
MSQTVSARRTLVAAEQAPTSKKAADELAIEYRDQAILLSQAGRFAESEACSREALRKRPDDIDVLNELGAAVWRQRRPVEAEEIYRRACQIRADDFRILTNLGLALYDQGRIDEAGDAYRHALRARPDSFDARMNLGIVLSDQGNFDEAMDCFRAAEKLRPDSADVLQNIGMNLGRQGRSHEAVAYFERAVRLRPDFPEGRRNLAYALLCCGDYQRGWPEYEWRLKCDPYPGYRINRTFWNGDDLHGRTILLHTEQGLGDTLQFMRFAPLVKRRGGRVLLLCQPRLLRLVARCEGVDLAFDGSSFEPTCHVHVPLLSLPSILCTTLETIPARVPYLFTDKVLVEHWRSELARALGIELSGAAPTPSGPRIGEHAGQFLVGIAWQGNPARRADHWRSFPLTSFAPLAQLPGVRLISLQTEHGLDQLEPARGQFPLVDLPTRRGRDFLETAAIVAQLDLVITPDTAIAHLAGGLGVPVWTGLCAIDEWRWLTGRDESPWYPTMKLFRQTRIGDWEGVFGRMTAELKRAVSREMGDSRRLLSRQTP